MVEIKGMEEVIAAIKKVEKDSKKRNEILKLLRRQAKPLVPAIRAKVPKTSYEQKGISPTENLKKSIGITTGRSKTKPMVFVGPRKGKRQKYDGYYSKWVQFGSKFNKKPFDYVSAGFRPLESQILNSASNELVKHIEKKLKNNKFDI